MFAPPKNKKKWLMDMVAGYKQGTLRGLGSTSPPMGERAGERRLFNGAPFNSMGLALLMRDTYDYVTSRPRLQVNQEGEISVAGGVRRVTDKELSASKPAAAADEASKPKP